MANAYKAVVFDMDGTLVDSERAMLDLWVSAARAEGFDFSREVIQKTIGTTNNDTMRIMAGEYPGAPHEAIRAQMSALYRGMRDRGEIGLRPGAREAIAAARALGLRIALCTSTGAASAELTLKSAGISDVFDAVICGGDVTRGKPDPEPYLTAAARLGVDPRECLAVEDSPSGARSALAAGMDVAFVPDIIPVPRDVADSPAAAVFENLAQIIPLFTKRLFNV
jgi:HAD superfamily hydrolase (TIGR01509 family)